MCLHSPQPTLRMGWMRAEALLDHLLDFGSGKPHLSQHFRASGTGGGGGVRSRESVGVYGGPLLGRLGTEVLESDPLHPIPQQQ